ncbi:hypothetical protein TELCIR_18566 [Teladorsagia circumcincta]|uniref:Uncharacterized protein n=1 Tax=Teladorsagia circumcincta TaxID=45464 RepID=A0A2G9TPN7_TELCI|nr:hypothetical protein TELCIR_18566 [Teladorsagia circumcincta]
MQYFEVIAIPLTMLYFAANFADSVIFDGDAARPLCSGAWACDATHPEVEIRFNLKEANWLSEELKDGLARRLANRINSKGELIIESERTRERHLNLADCFDKLRSTIYDVERSMNSRLETEEDAEIIRKVEIRFNLKEANWLSEELKDGLARRLANRINSKGELIIESERTRERHLNLADCFDKLRSTIYDVERSMNSRLETEEDAEIIRKKAALAAQHRLAEKRKAAEKRRLRSVQV